MTVRLAPIVLTLLDVTDSVYDGMQHGTITSVMPTNETPPNYNVSVVGSPIPTVASEI